MDSNGTRLPISDAGCSVPQSTSPAGENTRAKALSGLRCRSINSRGPYGFTLSWPGLTMAFHASGTESDAAWPSQKSAFMPLDLIATCFFVPGLRCRAPFTHRTGSPQLPVESYGKKPVPDLEKVVGA